MRAELSSIKIGDRVVYAVGGVEYNAIALGTASEGYNQGIRLASIFLSLIYLNELGTPVKIIAAPLLGVAADDEHLLDVAETAAKKTFGYHTATEPERTQMANEQLEHIRANPRTNGWRPYVEGEEVASLKATVADLTEQLKAATNSAPEDAWADKTAQFLQLLTDPIVAAYVLNPANEAAVWAAIRSAGVNTNQTWAPALDPDEIEEDSDLVEKEAEPASLDDGPADPPPGPGDGPIPTEPPQTAAEVPDSSTDPIPTEAPTGEQLPTLSSATEPEQSSDQPVNTTSEGANQEGGASTEGE